MTSGSPAPQLAAPSGLVTDANVPTPMLRWVAVAALSVVAMLATLDVWLTIFHIPMEFPAPSLFAPPRDGALLWMEPANKPKAGWMAWYVPVLTTAFFASVVLARLTRQRQRWSVLSMAVAGIVAVLVGTTIACWAEHNGYMWYFRPDMTLRLLLSVQFRLVMVSLLEAVRVLSGQWTLLATGAAAGAGCAFLAHAPLTRPRVHEPAVLTYVDERTELYARIGSATVLLILSQMGSSAGHPLTRLAAGGCIAVVWFLVAFPRAEFEFKRLLLGSFVAALAGSSIQAWMLAQQNPLAKIGNPFMAHAIFAHNATNFAIIFVVYFIGLTLIFSVLAKLTVWLCRQRVSG